MPADLEEYNAAAPLQRDHSSRTILPMRSTPFRCPPRGRIWGHLWVQVVTRNTPPVGC